MPVEEFAERLASAIGRLTGDDARAVEAALASMLIYILMALILVWKPTGLMSGAK